MSNDKINSKQDIQSKLTDKMMGMFDSVAQERIDYYKKNPEYIPNSSDINKIISKCGNKNAAISGSVGLIPGPFGMAAAIPEVALIIRNQVKMIYDLGMAYGKSKILTKELLAGIFAFSIGSSGIGLLTMHGSKVLVKRASLRVFQRIITILAGNITQKLLKSMISKWLPFVGAAAMAAWSKYSTNKVGKMAKQILSKNIEIDNTEIEMDFDIQVETEAKTETLDDPLMVLKVISLINLMKVDGKIKAEEIAFIEKITDNSEFSSNMAINLRNMINSNEKKVVDYTLFTNNPDESTGLLIDLIALARRDNEFHITEKMYIKQVGKTLGYSEEDLSLLMEG
jgi:uncharacterized protein (DUF697 family)